MICARALPCVLVGLFLFAAAADPAAAQQSGQQPVMTVTGEGTVQVSPDMAQISAGVTTQTRTAREASEANAKAMAAVVAALKAAQIAERDIQTTRLSLMPVRDTQRAGGPRITGFQASNQVTVRLRQPDRVGEVVDALVAAGATDIGGIQFMVSDPDKRLDEARAEAIADAQRKAGVYAKAAGVSIGRVLAIDEAGTSPPPMPLLRAARSADAATPVMPGEQTLRIGLTVTFQIIP